MTKEFTKLRDYLITNNEILKDLNAIPLGDLEERIRNIKEKRLVLALLYLDIFTLQELEVAFNYRDKPDNKRELEEIVMSSGIIANNPLLQKQINALRHGMFYVPLDQFDIPDYLYRKIARTLATKYSVLPFRTNEPENGFNAGEEPPGFERSIWILIPDPTNNGAKDAVEQYLKNTSKPYKAQFIVADRELIEKVVASRYTVTSSASVTKEEEEKEEDKDDDDDPNLGPANEFYDRIFNKAVNLGASDVHIEGDPDTPQGLQVRMRIDGSLQVVEKIDPMYRAPILSVVKMNFGMNTSEKRKPQSGRAKKSLESGREIDLRGETLPAVDSEDIVIRLLDKGKLSLNLDDMGWEEDNLTRFRSSYLKPYGAILVTGPTGSGKTSTLYAVLKELTKTSEKLITIEEPVEYQLPGLRQVAVNPKIGLQFNDVLRAILRSDPDIIMVGEIRDKETAQIAIRAASTGHLLLSTLHVNEAAAAPVQLIQMDVPDYMVADSLVSVVAQRLVRCLCPHCKKRIKPHPTDMKVLMQGYVQSERERILGNIDSYNIFEANPKGCSECQGGYAGRTAIHEVLTIGDREKEIILKKGSAVELRQTGIRHGGMRTLRQDAITKALNGKTSFDEVRKRTVDDSAIVMDF